MRGLERKCSESDSRTLSRPPPKLVLRLELGWAIAVGLMTMLFPVLGPAFGRAGHLWEIPVVGVLGAGGGILWGYVWSLCLTVYDVAAIVDGQVMVDALSP